MPQKAQSKKLLPAWLILSNKPEELKNKIFLCDLLFEVKEDTLVRANARKLWLTLSSRGLYLHPALEAQYMKQRVCFFCGGEIITHKADEGNYEEVCSDCGYTYLEK